MPTPPALAPPARVTVTVRLFAGLREQRGTACEQVEVVAGTTVAALYAAMFPPGPEGRVPVAFAVDMVWVPAGHGLAGGEEVAFLPPLGGG